LTAAHNLCIKAKLQLPLFCSAEKIHLLLPQAAFVSLRIFLMFGHGLCAYHWILNNSLCIPCVFIIESLTIRYVPLMCLP